MRFKICHYNDLPAEVKVRYLGGLDQWLMSMIDGWRVIATEKHVAIANRRDEWYIYNRHNS